MQFDLSPEEQDLLRNLLEEDCQDLRAEIRKTESHEFKTSLQNKEKVMEGLLERLTGKTIGRSA
jgi:hypothetical protein